MDSTWQRFSPMEKPVSGGSLFLLVLVLSACGGQPGVLLDIGTWPEPADSLRIDGALNGIPFPKPLTFQARPTRFVVYLPEGDSGQLSLRLTALDGDGCPRAVGEAEVEVGRGLRRITEAQIAMVALTPPYCPAPYLDGSVPAFGNNFSPTTITLLGGGFRGGAVVTVGGRPCTDVNVVSSAKLTCSVPGRPATCGRQAVVVTNNDAQSVMGNLFSYLPAAVSFAAQAILTGTGTGQRQLIAADFNGDGKLDLVSVNFSSDDISIYVNDGMGGFGPATRIAVGSGPVGLAAGDLNQDTKLDLVVANAGGNSISFLAGNGLGGFAAAVHTTGLSAPQGVAIGDISKDGIPDVLVTNLSSANVAVFIGVGTGGLVPQPAVSVGTAPRYLALADLNQDGNLDLVVPNLSSHNVSYRPGLGNARFGAGFDFATGMSPVQVVVNDVNRDQRPDIIVANQDSSDVTVLLGMGGGSFIPASGSPFVVGAGPNGLAMADIDGDGSLDILTANYNAASVSILAGDGAGGFLAFPNSPFATDWNPFGIATGDFNADGLIDLATAHLGPNHTRVHLGLCN